MYCVLFVFSKNGRTPLHTAALAGSFATVNLLIAVGANINRY